MTTKTTINKFHLTPLPYAAEALAPHISAETLHYHHGKHAAAYVEKLNSLIHNTPFATASLEEIVLQADGAIFNNAAQVWNHAFYFEQFAPRAQHHPTGALKRAIDAQFGSFEALKERMTTQATTLFGSGWTWLAADRDGRLYIISKPNAGTPLTDDLTPLLAIDVWEHAYYIDYRNMRKSSIDELWKVVDWHVVDERYEARE